VAGGIEQQSPGLAAASFAAAAVVGFDLAGRATRDALVVGTFGVRALPLMFVAGSVAALVTGLAAARYLARAPLVPVVRGALLVSAIGLATEWALLDAFPRAIAVIAYIHFTALSGLFISSLWAVASERFDRRMAQRIVGRLAAAGTAGGVFGGILAVGVATGGSIRPMLIVLALLNVCAAVFVSRLRPAGANIATRTGIFAAVNAGGPAAGSGAATQSAGQRLVRMLLVLIVFGAVAETLLDFVFMARASATNGEGPYLLGVFATFYTVTSIVTVMVQLGVAQKVADRVPLAPAAALLPGGVLVTSVTALVWPGLASAIIARGTELVLRNSVFRAMYEKLLTALGRSARRSAKMAADVTAFRAGRIVGAACIQLAIIMLPGREVPALLVAVVGLSAAALAVAPSLRRWHRLALEEHLEEHLILRAGGGGEGGGGGEDDEGSWSEDAASAGIALPGGSELFVTGAFEIPTEATETLVSAFLDPAASPAARRRLAVALADNPTAASRDALMRGLSDKRFEVRYRCGQALSRLVAANAELAPGRKDVFVAVAREVGVARPVWESRRAAAQLPDEAPRELLGEVLQERTDRSLEHVFRVLSLSLPPTSLAAAYRGVRSTDPQARGVALAYLANVLPSGIRQGLWTVLDAQPGGAPYPPISAADQVDSVLLDNQSIAIRVDELRQGRQKPT
jgi:hypothetical protein